MSNNIFDLQSYYEKTVAFVVNKFFFSITTGLIYIYNLISNQFSKVHRKPTVLKFHEKETPEEHFFIEHLWMEAVRDVLTLILMTHFKEC